MSEPFSFWDPFSSGRGHSCGRNMSVNVRLAGWVKLVRGHFSLSRTHSCFDSTVAVIAEGVGVLSCMSLVVPTITVETDEDGVLLQSLLPSLYSGAHLGTCDR